MIAAHFVMIDTPEETLESDREDFFRITTFVLGVIASVLLVITFVDVAVLRRAGVDLLKLLGLALITVIYSGRGDLGPHSLQEKLFSVSIMALFTGVTGVICSVLAVTFLPRVFVLSACTQAVYVGSAVVIAALPFVERIFCRSYTREKNEDT